MPKRKKSSNLPAVADGALPASDQVRQFFGPVDLDATLDDAGIADVVDKFHLAGRMVGVINSEFVLHAGQWLILLKRNVPHGQWGPFLERHFPDLPMRTAQWWMAEARHYLEHGERKSANTALLGAGGRAFDEADAADLDAADLADPKKPAPRPRGELERDLKRLAKRLAARDKREEALQREIEALEGRLERAEASRDEDETPEEYPLRKLLAKAVLTVGRVGVVYTEEASREDLAEEIRAGAIASLLSRLHQQTDLVTQRVYDAFRIAFPGKLWRGPEPPEPPEPPESPDEA